MSLDGFPYEGVSFDMDGTLYPLDHLKVHLALRKPADLRFWMTMERVRRGVRRSHVAAEDMAAEVARQMAEALSRPADEVAAKIDRIMDEDWPWLLSKVGPFRGVRPLLDRLTALSIPFVVNSDYPGQRKIEGLGLADYPWAGVLDATACGALKPRPEVFLAAAAALGVEASRVLHVGDSPELDIEGANAAGLRSVLVGRHKPDLANPAQIPTHRCRTMNAFCGAALDALTSRSTRR